MMDRLRKLIEFSDKTSKIDLLKTSEKGRSFVDKIFKKIAKSPEIIADFANDFTEEFHIELQKDEMDLVLLTSFHSEWSRPETFSGEGYLEGGFAFNGLTDIYRTNPKFWKDAVSDYVKYESKELDINLLESLRWFESLNNFVNPDPNDQPFAGCFKLNDNSLPSDFYFFDGGLVYTLEVTSINGYLDALLASAGVTCWQYFYVKPEEIINKNIGVNYMTWVIKRSRLCDGINDLTYNENIKFDRLDLVAEYLERCVRVLPETFPFLDFTSHMEHYNRFKELYDKEKLK